jgi:AcrR family transcriptional regulator
MRNVANDKLSLESCTVPTDLSSVKMIGMLRCVTSATTRSNQRKPDRYHHGDLPNTLRRAAVDVIVERGLGNFSLREVARRAGVSHTAPAHHFGDVRGMLTAVATEGFDTLADAMTAAIAEHDDPVEQLNAIGVAYVDLARSHPAHCEVMFRHDLIDEDDMSLTECGLHAYAVLEQTVQRVIDAEGMRVAVDDAAWMCWSAMQGLVQLESKINAIHALRGATDPISTSDLVRRFTTIIVRGMRD